MPTPGYKKKLKVTGQEAEVSLILSIHGCQPTHSIKQGALPTSTNQFPGGTSEDGLKRDTCVKPNAVCNGFGPHSRRNTEYFFCKDRAVKISTYNISVSHTLQPHSRSGDILKNTNKNLILDEHVSEQR